MKKLLFIILPLIFFAGGCKKKDDQPLPPELRQEFNCYINGEYWTMKGGGSCWELYTLYAKGAGTIGNNPPAYLVVSGEDCETDNRMDLIMDSVYGPGAYHFPEDNYNSYFKDRESMKMDTSEIYPSEHYRYYPIKGTVHITELTPQSYRESINPETGQPVYHKVNGWIEGTFEMTMINDISKDSNNTKHDTLRITNGKFAAIL